MYECIRFCGSSEIETIYAYNHFHSKEDIVKYVDTTRRVFQLHDNAVYKTFGYLRTCEIFCELLIYYTKSVKCNIASFL